MLAGRDQRLSRRPRGAERLDGLGRRGSDGRLAFWARERQLLVAIGDRAGLQQHRRHLRVAQKDQLVVAIDTGLRVDQDPSPAAHEFLGVVWRILQAALLQAAAEQLGEEKATAIIAVVA